MDCNFVALSIKITRLVCVGGPSKPLWFSYEFF